jgi:hypothetical protein
MVAVAMCSCLGEISGLNSFFHDLVPRGSIDAFRKAAAVMSNQIGAAR